MKSTLLRLLRSAVATGAAAVVASWQSEPWYLIAGPILQALGKLIRSRWPKLGPVIPF